MEIHRVQIAYAWGKEERVARLVGLDHVRLGAHCNTDSCTTGFCRPTLLAGEMIDVCK